MNRKSPSRGMAGVIVSVLIVFSALKIYDSIAKRLPISQEHKLLAQNGVTQNKDWVPVIRQFEGMDWALVPAGCFNMGSTESQLESALGACKVYGGENCPYVFDMLANPDSQTCFDEPYWIHVTEVTNREYGSSSSTNRVAMYRGPGWPRETVTWHEATAFCESIGARLPTEAEWEYAARGPDGLIYPWGNEFSPIYREQANMLNPEDVDSVPADTAWVGALGMSGNVMEWVADPFNPASTPAENTPDASNNELRIARGGSWASYADFLLRATQRIPYASDYASSVLGFRCVRDFTR